MGPTSQHEAGYDLRALFRAAGTRTFEHSLSAAPDERRTVDTPVELMDDPEQVRLPSDPLHAEAFIDGIQATITLSHREQRPVYLTYQAAGAVGAGSKLAGVREKLAILCSGADIDWVDTVNTGASPVPVVELAVTAPPDVERAAHSYVGETRELLEHELVDDLVAEGRLPLVADGSLLKRVASPHLYGVVKNATRTKYLDDESSVWSLPAGWRTARFKLPAGTDGCLHDRYSCYVRLHDARARGWAHGLIRLEAFTPDNLDALGARAMVERQHARSGDGRWDRHLASVAETEKVLRSRRPDVYNF